MEVQDGKELYTEEQISFVDDAIAGSRIVDLNYDRRKISPINLMQLYKILEHITSDSEAKCIVLEEQDYDDIKKALIKKLYPNNQEEVVGQTTQDIMSTFVGKAGVGLYIITKNLHDELIRKELEESLKKLSRVSRKLINRYE